MTPLDASTDIWIKEITNGCYVLIGKSVATVVLRQSVSMNPIAAMFIIQRQLS